MLYCDIHEYMDDVRDISDAWLLADQTFQIFVSEEILLKMIQTKNQKENNIHRFVVSLDYKCIITNFEKLLSITFALRQ